MIGNMTTISTRDKHFLKVAGMSSSILYFEIVDNNRYRSLMKCADFESGMLFMC